MREREREREREGGRVPVVTKEVRCVTACTRGNVPVVAIVIKASEKVLVRAIIRFDSDGTSNRMCC